MRADGIGTSDQRAHRASAEGRATIRSQMEVCCLWILSYPTFATTPSRSSSLGQRKTKRRWFLARGCGTSSQPIPKNFLLFGPDEVVSNRLNRAFDVTDRKWMAETVPGDDHLSRDGRVIEVISEHLCEGLLEGYLLTGRHGLFTCATVHLHARRHRVRHAERRRRTSRSRSRSTSPTGCPASPSSACPTRRSARRATVCVPLSSPAAWPGPSGGSR